MLSSRINPPSWTLLQWHTRKPRTHNQIYPVLTNHHPGCGSCPTRNLTSSSLLRHFHRHTTSHCAIILAPSNLSITSPTLVYVPLKSCLPRVSFGLALIPMFAVGLDPAYNASAPRCRDTLRPHSPHSLPQMPVSMLSTSTLSDHYLHLTDTPTYLHV